MLLLVIFGAYCIGGVLGLLAHEAGHWIVARLFGFTVLRVVIGVGPVWYQGRLGKTAGELRRYPTRGEVHHALQHQARKLAMIAILFGGIAGNIALLGLIALVAPGLSEPPLDSVRAGLVCSQIVMICISLSPHRHRGQASDGRQVISLLFDTWHEVEKYSAMVLPYRRADDPPPSKLPSGLARASLRFDTAADRAAAARDLLRELDLGQAPRAETLLALEQLVTRQLLHGDADVVDHLDELSKRAIDLAPDLATLRGTRGASLVELGRYDEGKMLLAPLVEGQPSFDTTLSQLFLARAEHALGARAEARRLVDAARLWLAASPHSGAQMLLVRVEAETAMPSSTWRPSPLQALRSRPK